MAKKPVVKKSATKVVKKDTRPKEKVGPVAKLQEGVELDDKQYVYYDCGSYGEIALTEAEKVVLDKVGNDGTAKRVAYESVFNGGNNVSVSAAAWFSRNDRKVNYLKYLTSKQVFDMAANISPYIDRITSVIHATADYLIDPLVGIKNVADIPEHILKNCKTKFTYDSEGSPKGASVEPYTLNDIMNLLRDIEEIDPVLGKQFKTQLEESKPVLDRG